MRMLSMFTILIGAMLCACTSSISNSSSSNKLEAKSPDHFKLETESPDKVYRVSVQEEQVFKHLGLDDFFFSWKIYKDSESIFNEVIDFHLPTTYSGRHNNSLRYVVSKHEWVANNVFWIGTMANEPKDKRDEIAILNKSSKNIAALAIVNDQHQIILILDLAVSSSSIVLGQPMVLYGPNAPSFHVLATCSDGTKIASRITEFPNTEERYIGKLRFCLTIKDDGIDVACRELTGRYDANTGKASKPQDSDYLPQYIAIPKSDCDAIKSDK
ncbi:MAG: hypothetical protein ACKVZH_23235 [Blastocatellia bacterium]